MIVLFWLFTGTTGTTTWMTHKNVTLVALTFAFAQRSRRYVHGKHQNMKIVLSYFLCSLKFGYFVSYSSHRGFLPVPNGSQRLPWNPKGDLLSFKYKYTIMIPHVSSSSSSTDFASFLNIHLFLISQASSFQSTTAAKLRKKDEVHKHDPHGRCHGHNDPPNDYPPGGRRYALP